MISLMAHMIPFYPDRQTSLKIALAMLDEGVEFLEIQFAFSDPGADGPVIEAACQKALANGFTVDNGFEFVRELMEKSPQLRDGSAKIFIMTYASIVYTRGIDNFCKQASQASVSGLIVPDLPLDSDEGLIATATEHGLQVVPVLAASSRPERIQLAQDKAAEFIYCALRTGITGQQTELGTDNISFLEKVSASGVKVLAGFGISSSDQIRVLDGHAHAAVVGSAFLRAVDQGYGGVTGADAVRLLVKELKANN